MSKICNHPQWAVDWSQALLSYPEQYRGTCTECGHTETRTSADWWGVNTIDMTKFTGWAAKLRPLDWNKNQKRKIDLKEVSKHINVIGKRGHLFDPDCLSDNTDGPYEFEFGRFFYWTDNEKPEWLEGFEYEVKYIQLSMGLIRTIASWPVCGSDFQVIAIKITGKKAGWE